DRAGEGESAAEERREDRAREPEPDHDRARRLVRAAGQRVDHVAERDPRRAERDARDEGRARQEGEEQEAERVRRGGHGVASGDDAAGRAAAAAVVPGTAVGACARAPGCRISAICRATSPTRGPGRLKIVASTAYTRPSRTARSSRQPGARRNHSRRRSPSQSPVGTISTSGWRRTISSRETWGHPAGPSEKTFSPPATAISSSAKVPGPAIIAGSRPMR